MRPLARAATCVAAIGNLRPLKRVGSVLLGAYVVYLVLANGLLNSPPAERLANRQPEKFRIAWGSALSLWPGQVRVSDLRVAGHTRRTVWAIQAAGASGRLAMWPLLRKEIRVPLLKVHGVAAGASRIDVERLPARAGPGGWTLRFDRIEAADVYQANLGGFVLRGEGRATAGFVKQMRGGPMQLLPSTANFAAARAWLDGVEVLQRASIAGTVEIDRHVRSEAPGIRKLLKTVATLEIDAGTSGVHMLPPPSKTARLRPLARSGKLRGRLSWNRGELVPGTAVALAIPVESSLIDARHALDATATVSVDAHDIRTHLQIAPGKDSHLNADLDLTIEGREIPLANLASLVGRADGHLRARWEFDSLGWLQAFLPGSRLVSFDGAGSVDADLLFKRGKVEPGSRLHIPRVDASALALGNVFKGAARATIAFEPAAASQMRARLDATMDEFSVAAEDQPQVYYISGQDLQLEAVSQGELDQLKDKVQARMVFKDARVPDLRVYNRYLPQGPLRLAGGSGLVSGDLAFDSEGAVAQGRLSVAGRDAGVDVGGVLVRGNFRVDTQLRRADLDQRKFVADGTRLSIDRLEILAGDRQSSPGWWGEVELPQARLDWGRPLQIDGRASLRVRDLEPLLVMFAAKKDLPAWVGKVVDEGEANVVGRISWRDSTLVLDQIQASNQRFEVLGQVQSRQKVRTGDLYVAWGKLGLGVELRADARKFHVAGARSWYDAQPALRPR